MAVVMNTIIADLLESNPVKKSMPVVKNVFTDKELRTYDRKILPTLPSPSPIRTWKLLTDQHSKGLYDRHRREIHKLALYYQNGIPVRDIRIVTDVFKKCNEYLCRNSIYEESMCELVGSFGKPFLKEKLSDEAVLLDSVIVCFTELGEICESSPSDKVRVAIAASLTDLYTCTRCDFKESLDFQPVKKSFLTAVVERSGVCKSFAECLVRITQLDVRLEMMKSLRYLSDSSLNCDDMLSAGAAGLICSAMNAPDSSGRLVFLSVEVLWNLLEYGSKEEVINQLNCHECISALQIAFMQQLSVATNHAEKQLRNDLLVISTLVASHCPRAPFVATGFVKVLALLASFPEVPSRSDLVKSFKLQQNFEDFECKKLLFNMMFVLSNDNAAIPIMSQQRVVLALFNYVRPLENIPQMEWTPAQYEELQLQAMSVLAAIAPLSIDDYMNCQGSTRLLLYLDWCIGLADYGGHGNNYYGSGGRGSKRSQMRYCIRLLRSIVSQSDEHVLQDLSDQGIISQIVGILLNASSSSDENDVIDIEMQCDMLLILACLCDGDVHRKELFGEQGVEMLIEYLHSDPEKILRPLGHHRLMLTTVDCVWSAVLGCFMNEVYFLEREGLFLLLDLLEVCPDNMQNLALGAILDLCENPKALPHLKVWKGKSDQTIGKLLVSLWKNEEKNLGVSRDPNGVILDPNKPLMSSMQERQGIISLPSSYPSPAIVDISENIRAKIYSMFCKLGFNDVPALDTRDYVIVSIIERYLDFKTLEVWKEVIAELKRENIELISPDSQCVENIVSTLEERAAAVTSVQEMLVDADTNQNFVEEEEYYEQVKDSHKQEEKAYDDFIGFVQRTSDYTALQIARRRQLEMIEHSRLRSGGGDNKNEHRHETTQNKLKTTAFCGRYVAVQSTPPEITKSITHQYEHGHKDKEKKLVTG